MLWKIVITTINPGIEKNISQHTQDIRLINNAKKDTFEPSKHSIMIITENYVKHVTCYMKRKE